MAPGRTPLVILMVGLPGVGKTTIARRLGAEIGAVTLSRDDIRDAIFPEDLLDYSAEQNQVGTEALLGVLGYLLARPKPAFLIVDGKPFSRSAEIETVKALVDAHGGELLILHCVAPLEAIEQRLTRGLADPRNVRAQRDPEKAARIREQFEPITLPHVVIDTMQPLDTVVAACLTAISERSRKKQAAAP